MRFSSVVVFVVVYGLLLISGSVFRIDRAWYDTVAKPSWTPSGAAIGIVWSVLFFCIALACALLYAKVGLDGLGLWLAAALAVNYVANQAYTYIQFVRHDWLAAGVDAAAVTLSAAAVGVLAWGVSRPAALLFAPYAVWSAFATYLSLTIWSMNR